MAYMSIRYTANKICDTGFLKVVEYQAQLKETVHARWYSCGHEFWGGVSRVNAHLSAISGGEVCTKTPAAMKAALQARAAAAQSRLAEATAAGADLPRSPSPFPLSF